MKQTNVTTIIDMLATRVTKGDAAAYSQLLALLGPVLHAYFVRQFRLGNQADDLVQETLLAVHTKFHTYKPSEPFTPWLYAVAKYKAIDYLRARKRRPEETELFDDIQAAVDLRTEDQHDLVQILSTLSARDRELLTLAKVEGFSLAQIGEKLGMNLSAVKAALHRAMKRVSAKAAQERP